jgi:PAS domain S-box-containing protein
MVLLRNTPTPTLSTAKTRWQSIAGYCLGLVVTAAMILLHKTFPVSFGDGSMLLLFMFPILSSALLGGFGPGLFAIALAAISTHYLLITPTRPFAIAANHDLLQWFVLIVNGVLASILSELLHRAKRSETTRCQELMTAHEQLRQSENVLQTAFELAAVGIALVTPDGNWLKLNQKLCGIVGYNQDELLKLTFQDITQPDDLQANLEQEQRMLAGEIPNYCLKNRYIHKDGSLVWVNLCVALVKKPDASPDFFIYAVKDIQTLMRAEIELQLWAQSFEHANFGLAITDAASNTFLAVNPAFAHERGYSTEELVGKPITIIHPANRTEEIMRKINALDHASHGVFETEHICKNGRRFPVLLDITVIKSTDDKPMIRVGYALDISERKLAEQTL